MSNARALVLTTGHTGRIGNASFDQRAASLGALFSFGRGGHDDGHGAGNGTFLLGPATGQPARRSQHN